MRTQYIIPVLGALLFSSCLFLVKDDSTSPLSGVWGGPHISIDFRTNPTTIEYDCAHGMIDGRITPDNNGNFVALGRHIQEHGGPIREDEVPDEHPAVYRGKVRGSKMTLTVSLADTGAEIGAFALLFEAQGMVFKCL